MYLQRIKIENYRNLEDLELVLHPDVNYFVGENAIGKSNFLDLLNSITQGVGFVENDFTNVNRPIRITVQMAFSELEGEIDHSLLGGDSPLQAVLRIEQVVQEVYPRVYKLENGVLEELPLALLRHALYVCHKDTSERELVHTPPQVYQRLSELMAERHPICLTPNTCTPLPFHIYDEKKGLDPNCTLMIHYLLDALNDESKEALLEKYTQDNLRLIMTVALKLISQIYVKVNSSATNLDALLITTKEGKRYLPIFISVDEPELHLSPYLQRSILNFYCQIVKNENKEFCSILKSLFHIDGLLGQLFIVTHSTDALVDDYRHIIRLYRNGDGLVKGACGATFKFPREVEKHLIMHFPEAKDALYSRCIILVEGETEYGSFSGFGKHINIDFDYYGICLINARGEASIAKLNKLFRSFGIPTVSLYDLDVKERYGKTKEDVFFTTEICYEMDLVVYLLRNKKRSVLDAIVSDLIEEGSGTVTKDMLKRGMAKLSIGRSQATPRKLKNISDRRADDLILYYFSWFYSNKGVIVGRRIAHYLDDRMIPPAFVDVIYRAKTLALGPMYTPFREE